MSDITGVESASEGQERPEPVEAEQQPGEPSAESQEPAEDEARGNREAAKYRTQLRAAEATIADHESHIAELQEHVVVGLITGRVGDPKVFGKLVEREAWVGEDGRIDLTKLDAAVDQILKDHPSLKPQQVQPRTKPRPGRGRPVEGRPTDRPSKLERAFGDSGRRWSDVVGSRGRAADVDIEAKSRKVRSEVSRNQDQ